jgi:two-component system chemotaxis sensor kinase CheA
MLDQFKQTYINECFELLADMENRLMSLEESETVLDELNAIFRGAHSIKGGAGAFGFDRITRFTHVLETLLDAMREGRIAPSREVVDALLHAVDVVGQLVHAANQNIQLDEEVGQDVLKELESFISSLGEGMSAAPLGPHHESPALTTSQETDSIQSTKTYRIHFKPHPDLFLSGNEPVLLIRELATLGSVNAQTEIDVVPELQAIDPERCYLSWVITILTDKGEAAIRSVFEFVEGQCDLLIEHIVDQTTKKTGGEAEEETAGLSADVVSLAANTQATTFAPPVTAKNGASTTKNNTAPQGGNQNTSITSIRVDIDKIDRLVNMVGELVITQSMLYAQTKAIPVEQYPELMRGIDELSQHSRELQEAVMSVRMQPVKSIFSRMPRIVRDLCGQLGKDIRLETSGENTEVDKTVIEQLSDPLTHMIRNSVDHGVEKPEIRIAKGKSAQGIIRLSASHRGGRIIIEIKDDGAGLNRERILSKAKEKKLIAEDAQLTDEEVDNLIFLPGFSTADHVSAVSGRGVGMDVVKRNIENLGGTIRIESMPDQGSIFTVSLPLTLAILDGMIVRVGQENYIIPIANIIETLRPGPSDVKKVAGGSDVMNVRGDYVAVIYLAQLFHIHHAVLDANKALIVLVESGRERFGLVVDELLGQQQVVIKTLETNADPIDGISGATILGDGKVSLILDIAKLASIGHAYHSYEKQMA